MTPTPDPLADLPPEARAQVEAGVWQWDGEKQIAYMDESGRVQGYMGLDGVWYGAPEGMVQIPAGDESGAEPFLIPGYRTMSDLMKVAIDELQWGERIQKTYFDWLTIEWIGKISFRRMDQPDKPAYFAISSSRLPGGVDVVYMGYSQAVPVREPNFSNEIFIVWEDPKALAAELQRIDQCVQQNAGAADLAELCKSEMIEVPEPGESNK